MQNQKNGQKSIIPSILCSTSRQFYTRRIINRNSCSMKQDKILKLMNLDSCENRAHRKMKTQINDELYKPQEQSNNMKKITRVKLENTIRKYGKEWKQLLECFDNYRKSSSKQILKMNQINFMLKMNQLISKEAKSKGQNNNKSIRSIDRNSKRPDNYMELVKLARQNQILKNKIQVLEQTILHYQCSQGIASISTQGLQSVLEKHQGTQPAFTNEGYLSLQNEVEVLRHSNDMLREQKKSLYEKMSELKTSNENLCEQIVKCRFFSSQNKQKFQMWKNIMAMQNQQITSLKRDRGQLKNQLIYLNRKYQAVLKRVKAISNPDQNKLAQISKKNLQVFSEQIQFFQKVKGVGWSKSFYQLTGIKQPNKTYYNKYLDDKDTVNNSNGIKKTPKDFFRYYKPTFYIFVEQYFQHQGIDKQNVGQLELGLGIRFLATLRSILDAKYNQYLIYKKHNKAISCLPAFVISWLSNFKIDEKTRKCEEVTSDLNFESIGSFYVKLMSPYLNGNWQVIAFRQFLLQTSTIDEMIFYLTARFKLMKGDSMTNCGAYMQTYYVSYIDVLFLIQQIVVDFGYRKKLQQYLKKHCQMHRKNQMIDAHFILRLLLEYYQFKKSQTFNQLSKAFFKYSKQFNNHMTFEIYLKIYDYNSFELNLDEKIEIYQKAFSLGKGSVCIENVFTVINQQGFLLKMVEKIFDKYPIIRQNGSHQSVTRMRELMDIDQQLNKFFQKNIYSQVPSIGLQSIKRQFLNLIKSKTLTFDIVFGKFEHIFELCLFTLKKLFFTKNIREEDVMVIIPKCFNFLKDMTKSCIQKKNTIVFADQFLKKNAARQILQFYRRKKKLKASIAGNLEQLTQSHTKTEQVRLQFVNLIKNLKLKYSNSKKAISQDSQSDSDF